VAAYEVMAAGYPAQYIPGGTAERAQDNPETHRRPACGFRVRALLAFCKLGEAVTFPAGSMKELWTA